MSGHHEIGANLHHLTSTGTLFITADDTTGALESAAGIADRFGPVAVIPHSAASGTIENIASRAAVIDLRSRHESAEGAAARLAGALRRWPNIKAHKIDSTLRGNWPHEIAAAVALGRRVLVVPAFPAAGRVCRAGVVTEHGVPVDQTDHARDPRSPVVTSRPATLLTGAVELADPADVAGWLGGSGAIAVADAVDDEQLLEVVRFACSNDDVLIVGTAAVIAVVARCVDGRCVDGRQPIATSAVPTWAGRVLVVCGSLHPTSRAQVDALCRSGAAIVGEPSSIHARVQVLLSSSRRDGDPAAVARSLATQARSMLRSGDFGTVMLLGGDTAEAFIDDRVVEVSGTIGVGIAAGSIDVDGRAIALVSKPGAFGHANTLVDLMADASNGAGADD